MRGIAVGTVLSLILWTALAWAAVCACTWFDVKCLSASAASLMASLMCINLAAVSAAIWLAFVCEDEDEDEDEQDAVAFDRAQAD